ncbi:xylan 1,4-beta-xylosidase [Pseudobutyrivibrio sp. ACV-2]|uniref:glycoside hydrolase family 43 protein n=1 Tax=Pseudobutyrivibrio sp. ACV-2 TaxID=1520801 RepID=UPI0008992ED2|nr:glycoside hydrolase family 43 protein [Pseudobutyrivibrio sp. ACV-2]SEA91242.1 xylan 1,4-beta-xylosidase [Pseudobutyrivibrio sp. ACV-2]
MIVNPILPGFNPDPCICKVEDDYYIAVSSFEWLPGIPIYHSKDLKNWELLTHVLDDTVVDLKKLPSAKGIWAPDLSYCEKEKKFYVIYGVMNNMNARYFDIDNYLITSDSIMGPWSEPIYIHSAGFDASIFHDDDGKKYILSLDWETRDNYEKPGVINIVEYDCNNQKIKGYPKRFWRGATDRGCIEAPRLTKHGKYYYIMCAEGGTGYNHCVSMGRSENIWGPYEADPIGAIVTSQPVESNERADYDHLKPRYYNPDSILQKSGHGSYVNVGNETYLVHITARPFVTDSPDERRRYRCTLGRETAIQKMVWTKDGWLRMADGSNLAKVEVSEPNLPAFNAQRTPDFDDFDQSNLGNYYYSPRISSNRFCDLKSKKGWLKIRGGEALTSLNSVSLLCRKLTACNVVMTTKIHFVPEAFQQSAGIVIYYDNMNYSYLRIYYSETLNSPAIMLQQMENGTRKQWLDERVQVDTNKDIFMRLIIDGRSLHFEWSYDNCTWYKNGPDLDTSLYSDEYCQYGEFTGTMVGITCIDRLTHFKCAEFDFIEYKINQ